VTSFEVAIGTRWGAALAGGFIVGRTCQPKVGDARAAVTTEQDVGGLEVAMQQSLVVRGFQSSAGFDEDVDDLALGSRRRPEPRAQRAALDVLHRDDDRTGLVELDVVDRDHVGMAQLSHGPCFANHSGFSVFGEPIRTQYLEGDLAV